MPLLRAERQFKRKRAEGGLHLRPEIFAGSSVNPGLGLRNEAFTLGAFASQFPRAADGFSLAASLCFGRLLEGGAGLHFPEDAFALHLLFQRLQRLIDVVIADHDLNYWKLSIGFPDRRRVKFSNV